MVQFDPNRPDFAPYGFACSRWAPTPMSRPDRHNEIELNLLGKGWLTYLLGGRKVKIEVGRLSAFWAAIPHQIIEYGEETEYFVATIPLAWFLQCKLPENSVQPLLHGQIITENGIERARTDYQLFSDWEQDFARRGAVMDKAVFLEIEARLIRLAQGCPPWNPVKVSGRNRSGSISNCGLSKVEQMACMIAQRYTEHLSVDLIAGSVGLHPNYAMNLFHRVFGTTLVGYLTQHRVSHAQRLLVTTDQKIVDIAGASGFGSLSRFNDAFRLTCGCSPREYRKAHCLG